MTGMTKKQNHTQRVQLGDTEYVIESMFGSEPLDEILAAYICEKIKEENNIDEAAA